jgi:hypothetical protein
MWEWGDLYAHLATVGHPPYVAFKLVEINTQYSVVDHGPFEFISFVLAFGSSL